MGSEIEAGRGGNVRGNRYTDVKAMPEGVREMYEVAMECLGSGKGAPAVKQPARLQPMAPQGSPPRRLMLGGLLFCLLVSLILLFLPR